MLQQLASCSCGAVPVRSCVGWEAPWYYTECVKCQTYTEAPSRDVADRRWNRKHEGGDFYKYDLGIPYTAFSGSRTTEGEGGTLNGPE